MWEEQLERVQLRTPVLTNELTSPITIFGKEELFRGYHALSTFLDKPTCWYVCSTSGVCKVDRDHSALDLIRKIAVEVREFVSDGLPLVLQCGTSHERRRTLYKVCESSRRERPSKNA